MTASKTALICLAAALTLVVSSDARPVRGPRDPGVNRRQDIQQGRIREGVRDGDLTRREVRTLEWKEARVTELERRLKNDGVLSPSERAKLQSELTDLSKEIYQQKHDAQKR